MGVEWADQVTLGRHTTFGRMMKMTSTTVVRLLVSSAVLFAFGCGEGAGQRHAGETEGAALLLSVSVFGTNEDGSPRPLPARLAMLVPEGNSWSHRFIEDPDSNVFHKAMAYQSGSTAGILTLGGMKAVVKLWTPGGKQPHVVGVGLRWGVQSDARRRGR